MKFSEIIKGCCNQKKEEINRFLKKLRNHGFSLTLFGTKVADSEEFGKTSKDLFTKQNNPKIENKSVGINYYKTEISEKLEKLEESFLDIATSYYLRLQLFDSKFSREKQEIILEDYKGILFLERIKWNDFVIINEEGKVLNQLLEEKIENYSDKDKYMVKDSFNYMLIEKAKERAKEIIKEKEKDV